VSVVHIDSGGARSNAEKQPKRIIRIRHMIEHELYVDKMAVMRRKVPIKVYMFAKQIYEINF